MLIVRRSTNRIKYIMLGKIIITYIKEKEVINNWDLKIKTINTENYKKKKNI